MTDIGIISLETNRQLTAWFINQDPTIVVFTPHHEEFSGGAKKMVTDPDREAQIVKFIYPGGDGIVITADGTTRRFDFIIVGEFDAEIEMWDSFDRWGNHYVVESIMPYNGYEVKVAGTSHGSAPDYG
jgi:hypothetical protein